MPGAPNPQEAQRQSPDGYSYDPTQSTYVPIVGSAPDRLAQRARSQGMQDTLFGKLNTAIDGINGGGSATSGSPAPSMITMDGGGGPAGNAVNAAADAANSTAFAKAKSQAGLTARSAVDTLRGEMSSRGIAGSGTEGRGLVDKLSAATDSIGNENNAEMQQRVGIAGHQQDLGEQASEANLAAGVTQRGQDVQAEAARAQIAAQRQQSLLAMLSSLSAAPAGMAY